MEWLQVKPVHVDQLVMASGDTQRLVNLATLSDSLDYLADAMQHFGDGQQARHSAQVGPPSIPLYIIITASGRQPLTESAAHSSSVYNESVRHL